MSDRDLATCSSMVIDICEQSFPRSLNNQTRLLCRTFFGQVTGPLLNVMSVERPKLADIMERVGNFLRNDGKVNDSAKLLTIVVQIRAADGGAIGGADHHDTLTSMSNLYLFFPGIHRVIAIRTTEYVAFFYSHSDWLEFRF